MIVHGRLQLGLVIPCYNEEAVIGETLSRLLALFDRLEGQGEIAADSAIFCIDDGSSDRTWAMIAERHAADARVRGLKLSRNRGHQNALLAGLLTASGQVLISMDADLQDDIEAIPRMIDAHRAGADIVFGVRESRDRDGLFKRGSAQMYYTLLQFFKIEIVYDHGDFRLMSRRALQALDGYREVNLFLRGLIPLLGFSTAKVHYKRDSRFAGETKYPLGKMVALALEGIVSFSSAPLMWIAALGTLVAAGSVLIGCWALWVRLVQNIALPGWASTVIPMYFLGGVQLLALGVIGAYLSRIYAETKQRPRFVIETTL